jgi:hypothetical protein
MAYENVPARFFYATYRICRRYFFRLCITNSLYLVFNGYGEAIVQAKCYSYLEAQSLGLQTSLGCKVYHDLAIV